MSKFMNTVFPDMNSQYQYTQVALNAATSYSALEGALSLEESFMNIDVVTEGAWESVKNFFTKIWNYICSFCNWVKKKAIAAFNWVKGLFKKKQAEKDKDSKDNPKLLTSSQPKLLNAGSGANSNPSNTKETAGKSITITPWVEPKEIETAASKCVGLCTDILNDSTELQKRIAERTKDKNITNDLSDNSSVEAVLNAIYDDVREYVDNLNKLFDNQESSKTIPEKDFAMIEKTFASLTSSANKVTELANQVAKKMYKAINNPGKDYTARISATKSINSILKQPILDLAKKISNHISKITRAVAMKMAAEAPKLEAPPEPAKA